MQKNSSVSNSATEQKVLNSGLTDFRKKVLLATLAIPAGKVTTYGAIAAKIGCGSAQAIGQALRHNPFAPEVPCHRVVNSQLKLHGFMGKTSDDALDRKRQLLKKEGVILLDAITISKESLTTKL